MRQIFAISIVALVAASLLSSCNEEKLATAQNDTPSHNTQSLPSGTAIDVILATALTSETAGVGTAWNGSLASAAALNGRDMIPAGSSVSGTVTAVKAAKKGDRAMLDLGLSSITVNGHSYKVGGTTEAVIAGSTRARNLGAIAGSAAGGALIGTAVSGSKGAVIGGVVGAGVATAVVASSDGYQVVLKQGTPLTFTTNQAVAVRI